MRLRKRYVVRAGYRFNNGSRHLSEVKRYWTRKGAEKGLAEMKRSYASSFHRQMSILTHLRWDQMIFELEDTQGNAVQTGLRNDEWCV